MRRLLPKPSSQPVLQTPANFPRRKRDQVNTACEACRRRKIKCDARKPACSNCHLAGRDCHFPPPPQTVERNALAEQLQAVSQTEQCLKTILELLRDGSGDESANLLSRIRAASSVNDFIDTFSNASLLLTQAAPRPNPPISRAEPLEPPQPPIPIPICAASVKSPEITDEMLARFPHGTLPISPWTILSNDDRYLTHLLNLFFTWDNVVGRIIFSQKAIVRSIISGTTEPAKSCSRFLIHSILAVSHIFMAQGSSPQQCKDLQSKGNEFAAEASRMLDDERQCPSISLLQGLIGLWVYESSNGQADLAAAFLDEFYFFHDILQLDDLSIPTQYTSTGFPSSDLATEWHLTSCIVWGFFCLEAKLSLAFSRATRIKKPKLPNTQDSFSLSALCNQELWFPYPDSCQTQPLSSQEIFAIECQLAELIHEFSIFFAATQFGSALPHYKELTTSYERLLAWHAGIPRRLLINKGLLPSLLFLNATYELVLLKLLRCFERLTLANDAYKSVSTLRASYGASIISNAWLYYIAHGPRHEYWLIQACIAAAEPVVSKLGDNSAFCKPIIMVCELLYSAGEFLPAANEGLSFIKRIARQQAIDLPRACNIILSAVAVRQGITTLRNVRVVDLGLGGNSPSTDKSKTVFQEVSFSSDIRRIDDI